MAIVGYWRLNGNSNDASGNGYNGSDTDVSYSQANGILNGGAGFNGSSSRIQVNSNAADLTSNYTISCLIKINDQPSNTHYQFLCKREVYSSAGEGFGLSYKDTNGSKSIYATHLVGGFEFFIQFTILLTIDLWYLLNFMYDGITVKLFINGIEKESQPAVNKNLKSIDHLLNIGNFGLYNGNELGRYLKGGMDEIKIINSSLSSAKIKNEYLRIKGFF